MRITDSAPDKDVDALVELLDNLVSGGSQHIDLAVGEKTEIRTVNSTDCSGKPGACAVPTFFEEDAEDDNDEF